MKKHWVMVLCLLSPACKDNAPNDKSGPDDPAPATESGSAATQAPVAPVAPVAEPSKLGETPVLLFDAGTGKKVIASWSVGGETMLIEARENANADRSHFQVDIYGSIPDKDDVNFYSCADLKSASAGRVELLLRGDMLHVLCINPPLGDDIGWTEAVRVRYSSDTQTTVAAGTYSGEGVVDPDTIDLDEAEIIDLP